MQSPRPHHRVSAPVDETDHQNGAADALACEVPCRPPGVADLDLAGIPAALDLFAALHAHNAALDPRFALADDWRPGMAAHLRHMVGCPDCHCRIAAREAAPVGLLLAEVHEDPPIFRHRHWVELLALYVAPAERGIGLADRLLADLGWWTTQRGFDAVQLYVTASNVRAQSFYARHGFLPAQVVMCRSLAPAGAHPHDIHHALPDDLRIDPGEHRFIDHRAGSAAPSNAQEGSHG